VVALLLGLTACGGGSDPAAGDRATTGASASASDAPRDDGARGDGGRGGSTPATGRSVPGPGSGAATPDAPVVPRSERPARVAIPAIGVDAPVGRLGIRGDGAIEVPDDARRTGWVTTTPAPGQQGPALIAGHVDSTTGPAVFYDLRTLEPGDAITVTREDGSTVDFTVDGLQTYPQDDFPSAAVYGPVPGPVLRLITCGGEYDASRGGYQDNVVVYAS